MLYLMGTRSWEIWEQKMTGSEMQNSGPRWRYRAKRTGSLDAKDLDFDMGCNMHDKLPTLT